MSSKRGASDLHDGLLLSSCGHVDDLIEQAVQVFVTRMGQHMDYKPLLPVLSRVCKSWRRIILPHLFYSAHLEELADYEKWWTIAKTFPEAIGYLQQAKFDPSMRNIRNAADTLKTQMNKGKFNVQEAMEIIFPKRTKRKYPPDSPLPRMPNVTHVIYSTVLDDPIEVTPAAVRFLKSFPKATHFEVQCKFADLRNAIAFFSRLPALTSLRVSELDVLDVLSGSRAFRGPICDCSKLEKLQLMNSRETPMDWLVDIVFACSPPTRLKSITCEEVLGLKAFTALLKYASETLQYLTFNPDMKPWNGSSPVLTKPFPSLLTMHIGTMFLGERHQPVERLDWIRRFIVNFPAVPKLQTITLQFFFAESKDVLDLLRDKRWSWETFFWTLQRNCPALKQFVLLLEVDMNQDIALPLKQEIEAAVLLKLTRRSPQNRTPLPSYAIRVEWDSQLAHWVDNTPPNTGYRMTLQPDDGHPDWVDEEDEEEPEGPGPTGNTFGPANGNTGLPADFDMDTLLSSLADMQFN